MDEFKKELTILLNKYHMAIVCKSNKDDKDFSVEIGFQDDQLENHMTGRHHITGYDMDNI